MARRRRQPAQPSKLTAQPRLLPLAPGNRLESLWDPKIPPFFHFLLPTSPGIGNTCWPSSFTWRPCSRSCTLSSALTAELGKSHRGPPTPEADSLSLGLLLCCWGAAGPPPSTTSSTPACPHSISQVWQDVFKSRGPLHHGGCPVISQPLRRYMMTNEKPNLQTVILKQQAPHALNGCSRYVQDTWWPSSCVPGS